MPIYEYRCESCGHGLEKLQRMTDPVLTKCPACGKRRLRRLVSAAGFRLKGGGWYETDFKRDNKRNLADSEGGKPDSGAPAKAEAVKGSGGEAAPEKTKSKGKEKGSGAADAP